MKTRTFERSVKVSVPLERLWGWHAGPGAFERLAPPWQRLIPVALPETLEAGAGPEFLLAAGPLRIRWRARMEAVELPHRFVDVQERGPFAFWRHEHAMRPSGSEASVLTDRVEWRLPCGLAAVPFAVRRGERELERLFRFRHERMQADLERSGGTLPGTGRTILVTGLTGLVGGRLGPYLRTLGYTVRGLSRGAGGADVFRWNPAAGWMDPAALEGVDAVIHLAGENIASGIWTSKRRQRIRSSRVDGTRVLVNAMRSMSRPPAALVCASGMNYQADGREHDEQSGPGDGFLSEVCRQWEAEAGRARECGVRTVCVRIAAVLDPAGGALGKMLPAFLLGLGGPIGSGRQGLPWIAMDDLLDILVQAAGDDTLEGVVNAVHPHAVTQGQFSRALGQVLGRPAILPVPARLLRMLLGQLGDEILLADLRVRPSVLLARGHRFRHASLEDALAFLLGRATPSTARHA